MIYDSRCFLRDLRESETGNVFPLTAAAVFVLSGLIGGGVDMSRAYMVSNRLQNACDAGVLAGRKMVNTNGFDTAASNVAKSYFNTNFSDLAGTSNVSFTPSSPNSGSTVEGAASATINTTIMAMFGYTEIPVSVECSATMQVSNSDVMMVLDTTGSMGWNLSSSQTRMEALQDAMEDFYDTLASASQGTNARIRYGFVPYSVTVNTGKLIHDLNPAYLADSHTYQSREAQYIDVERDTDEIAYYEDAEYTTSTGAENYGETDWVTQSGPYSWWGCRSAQPSNTAWASAGSSTTTTQSFVDANDNQVTETVTITPQSRTEYRCIFSNWRYYLQSRSRTRDYVETETGTREPVYVTETVKEFDRYVYKAVDYDTSQYKNFSYTNALVGDGGTEVSEKWNGCIEERATESASNVSYSSFFGLTPSGAYDTDINRVPNSDETRWKPQWPAVSFYRTNSSGNLTSASESNYGAQSSGTCPVEARLFNTMTKSEFTAFTSSLTTSGNTYHDIGMIWGARLSSPSGLWQSNVKAPAANGGDVSQHIVFMTDGEMATNYARYTAWGIEFHDRRVTDDGRSNSDSRHDRRLLAACAQAKDEGIRVWVIAFATELTSSLVSCASPNSAYLAENSSELTSAFQDIANQVGELRIVQ